MDRKMIDVHMHLIPGVDDGAEDLDRALLMLLEAKDQGIAGVFATSHSSAYDDDAKRTLEQYTRLKKRVEQIFPGFPICLGCEVMCEATAMDDIVSALKSGKYPTMNGTKYVLIEFSHWVRREWTIPCVEALRKAGFVPIIAHMERYLYLREDMELVDTFRSMNCLIQVNAYSLMEEGEISIKNWARRLVAEKKADLLGTDAHRLNHRPPNALSGLNWLYENHGDIADAIAHENPRKLLIGGEYA